MNENTPNGFTDDLNISLIGSKDLESLVSEILEKFRVDEDFDRIYQEIVVPNVIEQDRDIALDRAIGGIVRALTGTLRNRPDKAKDPIAYLTFQEVWHSFPLKGFLFKRRIVGGFWKEWNDQRLKRTLK